MAFVRWNQTTQIWELAATPESPSTAWNHLPISNPTLPSDTANKAYVDSLVGGGPFVPYNGATANVNLGTNNLSAKSGVFSAEVLANRVIIGGGSDLGYPLSVHSPAQSGDLFVHVHSNTAHYYAQVAGAGTPSSHRFYVRNNTLTDELRFLIESNLYARVVGSMFADYNYYEKGLAVPIGHWQAWIPTWYSYNSANAIIGNGELNARYSRVGNTIFWTIKLTVGTTTVLPASYWSFSLPVTAANLFINAYGHVRRADGTTYKLSGIPGGYYYGPGSNVGFIVTTPGSYDQLLSNSVPFPWAVNDALWAAGHYEVN